MSVEIIAHHGIAFGGHGGVGLPQCHQIVAEVERPFGIGAVEVARSRQKLKIGIIVAESVLAHGLHIHVVGLAAVGFRAPVGLFMAAAPLAVGHKAGGNYCHGHCHGEKSEKSVGGFNHFLK